MKKHFIFLLASIFTLLFAACSQENELDATPQEKSNLVSISTQLPADFAKTRALPVATDHKLRCILEVWSKEENPTLLSRHEKLGAAGDEKISFTFEVAEGTYNCLMWADFVASDATATEKTQGTVTFQGYEDKFYTTTDLKAVVVKDMSTLFNTEACDAFFGVKELIKGATAATVDASLSRPFAKLTIKEKDADSYAKCTNLSVSYTVPTTLNVADGTISGSASATYTGTKAGNNVYFTHYILANDETLTNILLSFTTENGTIEKTIPTGVPTKRNYRTNASGNFIPKQSSPNEATVDITFGNDWLDDNSDNPVTPGTPVVEAPKVGDFYYSDGSYSTSLNSNKVCIGVVFAVGAGKNDAIDNYTGTGLTGEIKGYVVAITDATNTDVLCPTKDAAGSLNLTGVSKDNTDFKGYSNTKVISLLADYESIFLAVNACVEYGKATTAPVKSSGWYLPSGGQIAEIAKQYGTSNTEATAVDPAILYTQLKSIKNDNTHLFKNSSYWGSNIDAAALAQENGQGRSSFRTAFNTAKPSEYGKSSTSPYNGKAYVRAILTF